jgi:hypothetical protein
LPDATARTPFDRLIDGLSDCGPVPESRTAGSRRRPVTAQTAMPSRTVSPRCGVSVWTKSVRGRTSAVVVAALLAYGCASHRDAKTMKRFLLILPPETYEPTLVWETEWQLLADYDTERACEEDRVRRVRRVGDLRRKIPEGSTRPEAKEVEELWDRITLARCFDRQHAR